MAVHSLYTGVSALKSFQRGMDVVGNDIANANTVGFKNQRVEYKDSFYDTLNRSVASDANFGATSTANQVGGGVQADTISTDYSQGQIDSTGVSTDLAILGNGFFKVIDENNSGNPLELFTRAGNFRLDADGFLVTQDGKFLQGQTAGADATVGFDVTGTSDGQGTQADGFSVATNNISSGSLSAGGLTMPATFNGGSGYFNTENGLPEVSIIGDGAGATAKAIVDDSGTITGVEIVNGGSGYTNAVVRFEEPPANNLVYTKTTEPAMGAVGKIRIQAPTVALGETPTSSAIGDGSVTSLAPKMQSFSVRDNGNIDVFFDNGDSVTIGKVLLQDFRAPQALRRIEGGFFSNDGNAGAIGNFDVIGSAPGAPGLGSLRQGSLELSNTNMSDSFADLIVTQRSFQGAARIITTSDELLREAVNLKR